MSMMIEKCLTLSTAHMPEPDPTFGVRAEAHEYGTLVFIGGAKRDGIDPWFLPIYHAARRRGCVMVNFDVDVETCDEFKAYEWK